MLDLEFDTRESCPRCGHRLYVREDVNGGRVRSEPVCHHCGWPSSVNAP